MTTTTNTKQTKHVGARTQTTKNKNPLAHARQTLLAQLERQLKVYGPMDLKQVFYLCGDVYLVGYLKPYELARVATVCREVGCQLLHIIFEWLLQRGSKQQIKQRFDAVTQGMSYSGKCSCHKEWIDTFCAVAVRKGFENPWPPRCMPNGYWNQRLTMLTKVLAEPSLDQYYAELEARGAEPDET